MKHSPCLRIVAVSDDDNISALPKNFYADILLSLGDISSKTVEKVADICMPERVFAVRGNHDSPFSEWPFWMEDLHGRVEYANGFAFAGMGGCWRYKQSGAFLFSQEEARGVLHGLPAADILISHNSPASYHERDHDVHQGFQAITEYIDRHTPRLVIHGHQHMNMVSQRNSTVIVGCYKICTIEIPYCTDNSLQNMRVRFFSEKGSILRKISTAGWRSISCDKI